VPNKIPSIGFNAPLKLRPRRVDKNGGMKAFDLFLFSLGIGLILLNAVVLASDYPRDFEPTQAVDLLAPSVQRNPNYRHIVVHDLEWRHAGTEIPFHFIIGDGSDFLDGAVIPTDRWRQQIGSVAIEIALSSKHTEKQERALLDLISKLRRDYTIPADEVGTHREIDPKAACPHELDGALLRSRL
jgi:hypothetical protein